MGRYTSYYTYQKFEKRGEQDWIPAYPNTWSIDGEGTMPLSIKMENDPACGYVPPSEPIYDWAVKDASEYICENYNKYQKLYKRVSYDNGVTYEWVVPYQTMKGSLIENKSTDCGYIADFVRWTVSGTACSGYTLYQLEVKEISYDNVVWYTTSETRLGSIIEVNSTSCGYVPPSSNTYRWVETGTYACLSGETGYEIYYRWMEYDSDNTMCDGYTERKIRIKEYATTSDCNSNRWHDTGERMPGTIVSTFTSSCTPSYTDERWWYTGNYICSGDSTYKVNMKLVKVDDEWIFKYPFEYDFTPTGASTNNCYKVSYYANGQQEPCQIIPSNSSYRIPSTADTSQGSCGTITGAVVGDAVAVIGEGAFLNTPSSITLSDSVAVVESGAFKNNRLTNFDFNDTVVICDSPFYYKKRTDDNLTINYPDNYISLGAKTEIIGSRIFGTDPSVFDFDNEFGRIDNLRVPSYVTLISSYAFTNGVHGTLNMGNCRYIKRIEVGTFYNNYITEITFPPNLEIIDNLAFYESRSLSSVTIPEGVKYIGYDAFGVCQNLSAITIPSTVEFIGQQAFWVTGLHYNPSSRVITVNAIEPPVVEVCGQPGWNFGRIDDSFSIRINVPSASVNKYKESPYWRYYKDYIYGI